jgi:hypothetical protein
MISEILQEMRCDKESQIEVKDLSKEQKEIAHEQLGYR